MRTTFTQVFLTRGAELLNWDDTPAGHAKRLEDQALLQELTAAKAPSRLLRRGFCQRHSPHLEVQCAAVHS
jgi:hypothetical protein